MLNFVLALTYMPALLVLEASGRLPAVSCASLSSLR